MIAQLDVAFFRIHPQNQIDAAKQQASTLYSTLACILACSTGNLFPLIVISLSILDSVRLHAG